MSDGHHAGYSWHEVTGSEEGLETSDRMNHDRHQQTYDSSQYYVAEGELKRVRHSLPEALVIKQCFIVIVKPPQIFEWVAAAASQKNCR